MNHEPLKECEIDVPVALQIFRVDYTTEETLYIGQFMKSVEACLVNVCTY